MAQPGPNGTKMAVASVFLLATFSLSVCSSVDKYLGTNQYVMISQFKCITAFETNVALDKMPNNLKIPRAPERICDDAKIHLLRTPDQSQPKLLVIWPKKQWIKYTFLDFHAIHWRNNSNFFTYEVAAENNHIMQERIVNKSATDPAVAKTPHYALSVLDSEGIEVGDLNKARSDWTEDPYEDKVYYIERVTEEYSLYVAPMDQILRVIIDGERGTRLFNSRQKRSYISVSGGLFVSRTVEVEDKTTVFKTFIHSIGDGQNPRNAHPSGVSFSVNITSPIEFPAYMTTIVVRDMDYCAVRDGADFDAKKCGEEKNYWLRSQGLLEETMEVDAVTWLLVVSISLAFLVVLLLVYIYWLRSTFTVDERGNRTGEDDASVFISKQRSFPSAYDPITMDVSVDKWN